VLAQRSEIRRLVLEAMNSIKPELRIALQAILLEESSIHQAKKDLGLSTLALKSRLHRGKELLKADPRVQSAYKLCQSLDRR
jgi:DNA-directed RNA polymerase specialized sigma24 family protein